MRSPAHEIGSAVSSASSASSRMKAPQRAAMASRGRGREALAGGSTRGCYPRTEFAVNESQCNLDSSLRGGLPRPAGMTTHPWLPPSRQLTAKIARLQATGALRELANVPGAALGARAAAWLALMRALPRFLRSDSRRVLEAVARVGVLAGLSALQVGQGSPGRHGVDC